MLYRLCLHPVFAFLFSSSVFIAFALAGILSFGNALWFDRLFFAVLVITALTCQRNVNILGIVGLIVLIRLMEESSFVLLSDLSLPLKFGLYGLIGYFFWRWRYDPLSPVLFGIFLITIAVEIYWLQSGYPAPKIYWECLLLFFDLFVRHCLFRRIWWTERFFPQQGKFLLLDWQLQQICAVQILITSSVILEYILRHLAITKSIFIYQLSTYTLQTITILILFLLFKQNYQLRLQQLFNS